jgi:vitellogenic carboxypeptidase-like protein
MKVGDITHDNLTSALFYIFYPSKDGNKDAPIVMWLQGGPGGSSLIGSFAELGPFKLECDEKSNCREVERNTSWNDHAHLLIVDNPVGTGYSYGAKDELVTTTEQAAEYLYIGLQNLYKLDNKTDCNFA